jgi:hypothetical protein
MSGGTSGLTFSGGPITTTGTFTAGGILNAVNGGTGTGTYATGDVLYASAANTLSKLTIGTSQNVLISNSSVPSWGLVSLTSSVTGTLPVASGGTGNASWTIGSLISFTAPTNATQIIPGTIGYALLSNGTGATPDYGLLSLSAAVTGTLPVANGGTGQTTYSNGQLLIGNSTGNTLTKTTLTPGTNISITNGAGTITINATDQFVGTVTSVGGTGSVNGITLTGTVTSSGNLTLGGTLSNVSLTSQVTGTLPLSGGGTGVTTTPTNGQLLIGNGSGYSVATLTAGSGISITNGAGSVTIAAIATATTVRGITLTGSAGTFSNAGTPGTYPLLGYTISGSNYGAGYFRSTSSGNYNTSNVVSSITIVNSLGATTSYTSGTDFSSSLTFSVMNDAVGFYNLIILSTALQTLFSDTATATTSPSLRPLNASMASDTTNPRITVSRSPGAPYNNTGFFGSGIYVTKVSTVYTLAFGTNDTVAASGFTVTTLQFTINNSLTTYIAGTDFFPSSPQNSSTGMFSMSMTVSNATLQTLLDNSIRA